MLLSNIELKPNKILVQPSNEPTSSFNTESRKYDRRSVAFVRGVSKYVSGVKEGEKIIYDDSNSIDFTIDGTALSVIEASDIVAFIREEK